MEFIEKIREYFDNNQSIINYDFILSDKKFSNKDFDSKSEIGNGKTLDENRIIDEIYRIYEETFYEEIKKSEKYKIFSEIRIEEKSGFWSTIPSELPNGDIIYPKSITFAIYYPNKKHFFWYYYDFLKEIEEKLGRSFFTKKCLLNVSREMARKLMIYFRSLWYYFFGNYKYFNGNMKSYNLSIINYYDVYYEDDDDINEIHVYSLVDYGFEENTVFLEKNREKFYTTIGF